MRLAFTVICLLFSVAASAQTPAINPLIVPDSISESTHIRLPRLQGFSKYYWEDSWLVGNIYLHNDESLKGYYLRYDVLKNQLEIIIEDQYRYITHNQIEYFEWYNVSRLKTAYFVNASKYETDEDITGFFEVLVDGEIKLLKRKFVYALRESASPTLVNDTDNEIRFFETYYIAQGKEIDELKGSRRKNIKLLNNYTSKIKEFVKEKKLHFNNENDLINIVNYYNFLLQESKNPQ